MTEKAKKDILEYLQCMVNTETPTPPKIVNDMLDLIPESVWLDDNAKILCPACKDGIFLREASLRILRKKYEIMGPTEFRKHQDDITDHILRNRMFGIAISYRGYRVTKRSLYTCSDKYSNIDNIFFDESLGRYVKDKDGKEVEKQCFHFIENIDEVSKFFEGKGVKDMQFDVIIGNPPYQENDGGGKGSNAIPLYNKFVQQAFVLNPKYITMIIPSRWYAGGRGLDDFRNNMLSDKRIRYLYDFYDATKCFPGIDLSGGVCYFLWDRDNAGDCKIITNNSIVGESKMNRLLKDDETNMFIRLNDAIPIINKIRKFNEPCFSKLVAVYNPFGLSMTVKPLKEKSQNTVKLYAYPEHGFIAKNDIKNNIDAVSKWKVFVSKAYGERGDFPYLCLGKPFVGEPDSCSSVTYLLISPTDSKLQAENVAKYMRTKFFRFLVLQLKNTQNATSKTFSLAPVQDFDKEWTDEKLYKKYGLSSEEIELIESMVRPMDTKNTNTELTMDTDDE